MTINRRPLKAAKLLLSATTLSSAALVCLPALSAVMLLAGLSSAPVWAADDGSDGATGGGGAFDFGGNGGNGGNAGEPGAAGQGAGGGSGGHAGTAGSPNGGDGGDGNGNGGGGGGGGFSPVFSGDITVPVNGGNGGDGGDTFIGDGGSGGGGGGGDGARIDAALPVTVSGDVTGGSGGDATFNGGGGGGGGAGIVLQNNHGLTLGAAAITGGNGGSSNAGGGNRSGGGGGAGVVLQQGGVLDLNGASVIGGDGGSGGGNGGGGVVTNAAADITITGGTVTGGRGNDAGSGGAGLQMSSGGTVNNAGTIQGGDSDGAISYYSDAAGGFGSGGAAGWIPNVLLRGVGGAGIIGTGLSITNSGTIAGGDGGSNGPANAITFTGGANFLGNTGTITGGIGVQGGSFAPALASSTIGSTPLTIGGPLTFASGTQYVVRLSPAANDSTTVSGAATLTGASVNAQFASGSYVAKQYTILTATDLGGTEFASLSANTPTNFTSTLNYDASHVFLDLALTFTTPGGLIRNQQHVADGLTNYFNSTGGIPAAFSSLDAQGLTQASGEAATGGQQVAFQLGGQFLNLMLDPFVNGRAGVGGGNAGGGALSFAPDAPAKDPIALAYASAHKTPGLDVSAAFGRRWNVWGAAYGGRARNNGDAGVGSHDLTANAGGVAAGMDYRLTADTTVGFALAGGATSWSLAQGLGGGDSDAFQGGVYGVTRSGPAYLGASFAFSNHWMSTDRNALGSHLDADFDAQSFGARIETGWRIETAVAAVTPYAALQAQSFHTPSYRERDPGGGGFGLAYNSRDASDIRSELGAHFDRQFMIEGGSVLSLRGKLGWAHDWVSASSIGAVFQALPGASFTVNGAVPASDSALVSAGAELRLANGVSLAAKFDGEFANGSEIYAGTGTLRFTF